MSSGVTAVDRDRPVSSDTARFKFKQPGHVILAVITGAPESYQAGIVWASEIQELLGGDPEDVVRSPRFVRFVDNEAGERFLVSVEEVPGGTAWPEVSS